MATSSCVPRSRIDAPPSILIWRFGPTLYAEIGYDPHYQSGQPGRPDLPDDLVPVLVDTGAGENCIDADLAQHLALPIEDEKPISGTYGTHQAIVYSAQIYIPSLDETIDGAFYGINLSGGGFYQRVLIGRNFLRRYVLHYDGRTGEVTISNDR